MNIVFAVEAALRALLAPHKMNLASLGNQVPHLHWHVVPRFADDSHFPQPGLGQRAARRRRAVTAAPTFARRLSDRLAARTRRVHPVSDDTTVQNPETDDAGSPARAAPPAAAPRVRRRRRRARWAKRCRSLQVAQAHEALIGQLRAARHAAEFAPRERARDRRGPARAGRAPAHRARAPLCRQAAARGRARDRGHRAGGRAVAGAVGAVLGVPEAAARRRSGAAGREGEDPAARPVRRQAARARARPRAPRRRRRRCGRSCTPTTGSPKCSTAPSPRSPTT